jgi:hypothetical protein
MTELFAPVGRDERALEEEEVRSRTPAMMVTSSRVMRALSRPRPRPELC